jgi:1-acyl-sn-glycerol-3-phosphate acyltransferase
MPTTGETLLTDPGAALATAQRVLTANDILVWFPEGWRSPDGRLQPFLPEVGELLLASRAAAVPVLIKGTFGALPRGRVVPRLHRVSVKFGSAASRWICAPPAPVRATRNGWPTLCALAWRRSPPARGVDLG